MPDPISVLTTHNPDPGWSPEERRARHEIFRKEREVRDLERNLLAQGQRLEEAEIKVAEWRKKIERTQSQIRRSTLELEEAKADLQAAIDP